MNKVLRIGTSKTWGGRAYSVYVRVRYDGGVLSMTGVEGPLSSGNCLGSCGQIVMGMSDERRRAIAPAPGWNRGKIKRLFEIWDRWHLNDMRAACEHQRAAGETWATHPGAVCPDCGYKLGSAWLKEEVPACVVAWLEELPDADRAPAWC